MEDNVVVVDGVIVGGTEAMTRETGLQVPRAKE